MGHKCFIDYSTNAFLDDDISVLNDQKNALAYLRNTPNPVSRLVLAKILHGDLSEQSKLLDKLQKHNRIYFRNDAFSYRHPLKARTTNVLFKWLRSSFHPYSREDFSEQNINLDRDLSAFVAANKAFIIKEHGRDTQNDVIIYRDDMDICVDPDIMVMRNLVRYKTK